jgi:hypothetical protein
MTVIYGGVESSSKSIAKSQFKCDYLVIEFLSARANIANHKIRELLAWVLVFPLILKLANSSI